MTREQLDIRRSISPTAPVPACGIRYQLCRNGWAGRSGVAVTFLVDATGFRKEPIIFEKSDAGCSRSIGSIAELPARAVCRVGPSCGVAAKLLRAWRAYHGWYLAPWCLGKASGSPRDVYSITSGPKEKALSVLHRCAYYTNLETALRAHVRSYPWSCASRLARKRRARRVAGSRRRVRADAVAQRDHHGQKCILMPDLRARIAMWYQEARSFFLVGVPPHPP